MNNPLDFDFFTLKNLIIVLLVISTLDWVFYFFKRWHNRNVNECNEILREIEKSDSSFNEKISEE